MTTNRLIGDAQPVVDDLLETLSIVRMAMHRDATAFSALYLNEPGGDTSAADLSYINRLRGAQATPTQADLLYRVSERCRPKWDEVHSAEDLTYGQMTIATAFDGDLPTAADTAQGKVATYSVENGFHTHFRMMRGAVVPVPLCNFIAAIVEEVHRTDGTDVSVYLRIEGQLAAGRKLPTCLILATQFAAMTWVMEIWGAHAVVYAGQGVKEHLRAAIQIHSLERSEGRIPSATVYTHLGWLRVEEQWVYLTAAGGIGQDGRDPQIEVTLDALDRFTVADPPDPGQLELDVTAWHDLLKVASTHVMLPLIASAFAAVLLETPFSVFLFGKTGLGKSQLAALVQSWWGESFTSETLPGNWSSTANSLEGLAHDAKDAVLVVDDMAPEGGESDVRRFIGQVQRLLRAQGNRQGRGRMRADSTQRSQKAPRGLLLITGEDLPRAASIMARSLVIEVSKGDVDWNALTAAQAHAADGAYARILAHLLEEIASDFETIRSEVQQRRLELRHQFGGAHARSADGAAALQAGMERGLLILHASEVLSELDIANLMMTSMSVMSTLARGQQEYQQSSDPVQRFASLLNAVLLRGQGHFRSVLGKEPKNPARYGWEQRDFAETGNSYVPRGNLIGYVRQEGKAEQWLLEPEAAFAEVQRLARDQGETLSFSQNTIWKLLKEAGLIERKESNTHQSKVMINGQRQRVVIYLPKTSDAE